MENIIKFEDIEQRFNELVFELQIQENKKLEEFREKLQQLKKQFYCKNIDINESLKIIENNFIDKFDKHFIAKKIKDNSNSNFICKINLDNFEIEEAKEILAQDNIAYFRMNYDFKEMKKDYKKASKDDYLTIEEFIGMNDIEINFNIKQELENILKYYLR